MQREVVDAISDNVREVLKLDEETLFMLRVDHGVEYLKKRFADDPEIVERLQAHAKFWSWWMELWTERDVKLLSMITKIGSRLLYTYPIGQPKKLPSGLTTEMKACVWIELHEVQDFYRKYHSPERIKYYPNEVLINQCLEK